MKIEEGEQHRGFLLSCEQNREKQAIRDAYNFLNEFIQKIYPDLQATGPQKKQFVARSLEDEVKELKKKENRVLFSIDTDVKCLIFIKINPLFLEIDPVRVVNEIMAEMKEERVVTRYCHRVLPVQRAFRAQFLHMKSTLKSLLSLMTNKAKGQKKSWSLHFKCRNNDKFKYKEILKEVGKIAGEFGHFAEIYYPEWTIAIEICNHLMCVSVLEGFKESGEFKLKKINMTVGEIREEGGGGEGKKKQEEEQVLEGSQEKGGEEEKMPLPGVEKNEENKKEEEKEKQKQKETEKIGLQRIEIGEDDVQLI